MLSTDTIHEFATGIAAVFGFRITGAVRRDDMAAMADRMLDIFEAHPKVDMLLVFETDQAAETGAMLSTDAVKAQFESLSKVRNYVVADAPGRTGGIVETMGKVMPVEARGFDTKAAAVDWLRAQPPLPA